MKVACGRGYRQHMAVMEAVWHARRHHRRAGRVRAALTAFEVRSAGFFTAWPVNTWLIRVGIKEAM